LPFCEVPILGTFVLAFMVEGMPVAFDTFISIVECHGNGLVMVLYTVSYCRNRRLVTWYHFHEITYFIT